MSPDRHEPYRDLLAERLDGPLSAEESARLEEHLVVCPACRAVAHDYEHDRERMRAIPGHEPPRDLWARTRAALDREVADDGDPYFGGSLGRTRGRQQLRVAIGSFIVASVVLAIAGGQLAPAPPSGLATSTPFAIPAQSVAFLGVADGELTLYRASVKEVCPPPRVDCADGPDGEAVVRLAGGVAARQTAMNRTGQLFIAGRDDLGAEVFAIVYLPQSASGIDGDRGRDDRPVVSDEPPASDPLTEPTPEGPERDPALEPTDPPTPEPTDGPDVLPSHEAEPSAEADPSDEPNITPPPSPTTAVATSQPILTGVTATGATAAWSPSGGTLAFSAMPVDRSHGSDVYVWRPGDAEAHAITDDHASLFASWSGERVVISRAISGEGELGLSTQTLVMDPTSREARAVDLESGWLPAVDPTRRFVVYWRGRLTQQSVGLEPDDGRLYLADWASIDPWRSRRAGPPKIEGEPDASDGSTQADATAGADGAAAGADGQPDGDPAADPTDGSASTDRAAPEATSGADLEAADTEVEAGPGADTSGSTAATPTRDTSADTTTTPELAGPTPASAGERRFLLDRQRAVSGRTSDWVARWSSDGDAFAVWTAEPGSAARGWLVVRSAPSSDAPAGDELVGRVRSSRSFSIGEERLAWVAPLASGEGDLWVSVWGTSGQGSVRLRRLDSMEAVPAN